MGLDSSLSLRSLLDMAKVLCILAIASTLSAAPTSGFYESRHLTNSAMGSDSIVESVMRSLGPQLDSAIEAALRGLSGPIPVTTTGFSSGLSGLTGAAPVTSFSGTVSSSPAVTVQLSGSSRGENSQSKWSSTSSSSSEQSSFEATSGFGTTSGFGSNLGLIDASSAFGATGFGATDFGITDIDTTSSVG